MNIHIDSNTGELVAGGYAFGPRLAEPEFLASQAGASRKIRSEGSRTYYEIWLPVNADRELGATLGFRHGQILERINFKIVKAGTRVSPWSKAVEDEIKAFHDQWLLVELGKGSHRFPWGRVMSTIEPHWNSATIVIDYSRKK